MRTINLNRSAKNIATVFSHPHLVSLQADPETAHLAAEFGPAHEAIEARVAAREEAKREVRRTAAVREVRERHLDRQIRALALGLLIRAGNDREAPVYRTYFRDGYGDILAASLSDKLADAEQMIALLAQESDPEVASLAPGLVPAFEAARAALEEWHAAVRAGKESFEMEQKQKLLWLEAYRASEARLALLFAKDPKRVHDYFVVPAPSRRRRPPVDGEDRDEAASGGGGPGDGSSATGSAATGSDATGAGAPDGEVGSGPSGSDGVNGPGGADEPDLLG